MNPIVERYIRIKQRQLEEIKQAHRREFLLKEGIYEKEYAPTNYVKAASYSSLYDDQNDYTEVDIYSVADSDESAPVEYPNSEWDPETKRRRFYKIIPLEISNEEYERIKEAYDSVESMKTKTEEKPQNKMATILKVIGIAILIAGFIGGIIAGFNSAFLGTAVGSMMSQRVEFHFSITAALVYWIIAFIGAIAFFALSEIIFLLQKINNKIKI